MYRLFCLLIGYAFGMIQSAFIVGRVNGIDIRKHGSNSAGSTNVNRVLGSKSALIVFAADIFKAVAACVVCTLIFSGSSSFTSGANGYMPVLYSGIGVLLGHNFPFYLGFKGGKGVASTVGLLFCFDWRIAVICYVVTILVIYAFRYVSLGSLVLSAMIPILGLIFAYSFEVLLLTIFMALLSYFQHRKNIVKLIKRTESKFSFKKSVKNTVANG